MIGQHDQVGVQTLDMFSFGFLSGQQVEVVRGIAQIGARLQNFQALAQAVEGGQDQGKTSGQRDGLLDARFTLHIGVHAPGRNNGAQRVHWRGFWRQRAQKGQQVRGELALL